MCQASLYAIPVSNMGLLMLEKLNTCILLTNFIQVESSHIGSAVKLDLTIAFPSNNKIINKHISIAVNLLVELCQWGYGVVFQSEVIKYYTSKDKTLIFRQQ